MDEEISTTEAFRAKRKTRILRDFLGLLRCSTYSFPAAGSVESVKVFGEKATAVELQTPTKHIGSRFGGGRRAGRGSHSHKWKTQAQNESNALRRVEHVICPTAFERNFTEQTHTQTETRTLLDFAQVGVLLNLTPIRMMLSSLFSRDVQTNERPIYIFKNIICMTDGQDAEWRGFPMTSEWGFFLTFESYH